MSISVCWFRKDLRLNDNPAWNSACSDGDVIPVFVLEPSMLESASQRKKDVMFSNLMALKAELESLGGYLFIIEGPAREALPDLLSEWDATSLHFNNDHSPVGKSRDDRINETLDIKVVRHWGNLVQPPGTVVSGTGAVHKVFTPYFKKWVTVETPNSQICPPPRFCTQPKGSSILPQVVELPAFPPGSAGAHERLVTFLNRIRGIRRLEIFQVFKGHPCYQLICILGL